MSMWFLCLFSLFNASCNSVATALHALHLPAMECAGLMHECKEKRTRTRPWATRCRIGREKEGGTRRGRRNARGSADDDNDDDDDGDDDDARSGFDAIDLMVSKFLSKTPPLFFFERK